jgi:hypothetical protein
MGLAHTHFAHDDPHTDAPFACAAAAVSCSVAASSCSISSGVGGGGLRGQRLQFRNSWVSLLHARKVNSLRRSSLPIIAMSILPCETHAHDGASETARRMQTPRFSYVGRTLASTRFCRPSLLSWRWYTCGAT